jgi:hypothetical protein
LRGSTADASIILKAADRCARLLGLDAGDDGAGAGNDRRMVVAVLVEAFCVDTPEDMAALHEDAQQLGLIEAQKIMPGYSADGAVSRLIWFHNAAGSYSVPPDMYRAALAALARGEDPGIGV